MRNRYAKAVIQRQHAARYRKASIWQMWDGTMMIRAPNWEKAMSLYWRMFGGRVCFGAATGAVTGCLTKHETAYNYAIQAQNERP